MCGTSPRGTVQMSITLQIALSFPTFVILPHFVPHFVPHFHVCTSITTKCGTFSWLWDVRLFISHPCTSWARPTWNYYFWNLHTLIRPSTKFDIHWTILKWRYDHALSPRPVWPYLGTFDIMTLSFVTKKISLKSPRLAPRVAPRFEISTPITPFRGDISDVLRVRLFLSLWEFMSWLHPVILMTSWSCPVS